MIEANWLAFVLALIIGVLVAWWLFGRASQPPRRERRPDVLDEGAAPAQRNQALIDTPPASAAAAAIVPPPMSVGMAGVGEVIAVAAQDVVEEAAVDLAGEAAASAPAPAAAPLPPVSPATPEAADDLRKIKGVGPKLVTLLHSLGITRYAQIAAWTDADVERIDAQLGAFAGRIRRDSWIEQAKFLSQGDTAGFEAKFGKL